MSWVQELTELAELKKLGELSSSHLPFQMDDVCINFLHLAWKNFAATGGNFSSDQTNAKHSIWLAPYFLSLDLICLEINRTGFSVGISSISNS
jgi:hypothetical protein